jgi:predicted amidophosphoribosyltransferase
VQRSAALDVVRADLTRATSGYLHNVRFLSQVTCTVCGTPTDPRYEACYKCNDRRRSRADMADRVGFVIYAWDSGQPGRLMYGYKDTPGASHSRIVQALLTYAVAAHWPCISAPFGPPDAWTTVPSLKRRPGTHPLETIAASFLRSIPQVKVAATQNPRDPREVRPANFIVPPISSQHVLVLEDSWVTGARVQSVTAALKAAGVRHVTAICVARWLSAGFSKNEPFATTIKAPFDPDVCPFTGSNC